MRPEGGTTIDILFLVDRLEELFQKGRRLPLTHQVVVEEQAFLDLIDQMRVTIPEEIRQAQRVSEEKDRMLAEARQEAEQTLVNAREQAAFLMTEKGLTRQAQAEGEQLVAEARKQAQKQMADADKYTIAVLAGLHEELARLLNAVHNGIERLQSSHPETKGD